MPELNYKISITYGSVKVAQSTTSTISDIFGPTVNRCFKINSLCPENGLIIDNNLYNNLKNFIEYDISQLSETEYKNVNTNCIIGFHGKHRSNFDLMIRHCKIISSIMDPRIKTNGGHLCKLLRSLSINNENILQYFHIIINHFLTFSTIDIDKLNIIIQLINGYVNPLQLTTYNINERYIIPKFDNIVFDYVHFFSLFENNVVKEQFFCIIGILCIVTDNYAYSKDEYPYDIYHYFNDILSNKKDIQIIDNIDIKMDYKQKRTFIRSDTENIKYNLNDNIYFICENYLNE
jgi:hypothetical protein